MFINLPTSILHYIILQVLLNKLGVKDSFYLLGYESGVTAALKLADILEAHGEFIKMRTKLFNYLIGHPHIIRNRNLYYYGIVILTI